MSAAKLLSAISAPGRNRTCDLGIRRLADLGFCILTGFDADTGVVTIYSLSRENALSVLTGLHALGNLLRTVCGLAGSGSPGIFGVLAARRPCSPGETQAFEISYAKSYRANIRPSSIGLQPLRADGSEVQAGRNKCNAHSASSQAQHLGDNDRQRSAMAHDLGQEGGSPQGRAQIRYIAQLTVNGTNVHKRCRRELVR